MQRLRILTLCSVLLAVAIFFFKKRNATTIPAGEGLVIKKEWLTTDTIPATPKELTRPPDQTFLTFPEWYLVFSPEEQAQYLKMHTSTSFPYMSHTAQIWESYGVVNQQIKGTYPYNGGYHFMIWVIGSSASVEYAFKAWYETLVGRITDTRQVTTTEDKFNANYTQAYVNFIKDRPWYEFDFKKQLFSLWGSHPFFGDHFARKMERRYLLSSELLVKMIYGQLIGLGTKTVYEEAKPTTAVLVDSMPQGWPLKDTIKRYSDGSVMLILPRYDKFSGAVMALAKSGASFREIAGNKSAILLTVLVPKNDSLTAAKAQLVFTQPIASDTTMKRVALAIPVTALNQLLLQLDRDKIKVEHVFDF